jgi:hypothetical protein
MLNFQGQQLTPFTEAATTQRSGFNALLSLVSGEAQRIEQNRAAATERAQQLADQKAKQLHELNKIAFTQELRNEGEVLKATDPRIRGAAIEDHILKKEIDVQLADRELRRNETSRINRLLQSESPNIDNFGLPRPPVYVKDFDEKSKTFTYEFPVITKTGVELIEMSEQQLIGHVKRVDNSMSEIERLQAVVNEGLPSDDFTIPGSATVFAGANRVKNIINRIKVGDVGAYDEIVRGVHNIPSIDQVRTQSSQEERIQRNLATAVLMHEDISKLEGRGGWFNSKTFRRGTENRISQLPDGRTVVAVPVSELLTLLQEENFSDTEQPIAADLRERLIEIRANFSYYNDSDLNVNQAYINPLWRRGMPANRVLINKAELDRITQGQRAPAGEHSDVSSINSINSASGRAILSTIN